MSMRRWEPFRELEAMQNEMRRLLGQLGGTTAGARAEGGGEAAWLPPVDVAETESELVLAFDLPGVQEDAIEVELEDGTLTVRGQRERSSEEREGQYYRLERRFGSFARSVPLPPGVDEGQIRADLRDGVLEIRVPKPEEPSPRRIQVSRGGQAGGGQGRGEPSSGDG